MPILACDGDHVGMPRSITPPALSGPIGVVTLLPCSAIDGRLNTSLSEEIRYEIDQSDVWRAADGFKATSRLRISIEFMPTL